MMESSSPSTSDWVSVEREVLSGVLTQNAELVSAGLRASSVPDGPSPLASLAAARSVGVLVDDAIRVLVAEARAEGRTWAAIGEVLHVTRQAAFQRFGSDDDDDEGAAQLPEGALPDAAERAGGVIDHFLAGRWEEMRSGFDKRMREGCSAELLETVRTRLAENLGGLLRVRRSAVKVRDRYTVVDVPLVFDRGLRKARVALDGEGRVAGFFVLMPEVR